ncbi:MAG: cytochrome C [Campylobacterota bacterium]|nr:cytochrome C [Campylobacterota bacterium]
MKKIIFALITLLAFGNLFAAYNINQCTGCHGSKFELKALNGSKKIVANMSELEIAEVLKAYKRKEYGGPLKTMMEAQVMRFSDKDLEAMAKEIKSLK